MKQKSFGTITDVANWLQCDDIKEAGPIILVVINSVIVISGMLAAIIANWQILEIRFLAIKDIAVVASLTLVAWDYAFSNNKIVSLIKIVDDEFLYEQVCAPWLFEGQGIDSRKRCSRNEIDEVIERAWHSIKKLDHMIMNSVKIVILFLDLTPLFINMIKVLNLGIENISIKDLLLPFFFLYPEGYENMSVYLIMYGLDSLFLYFVYILSYCGFATVTIGAQKTAIDLKIFRICLKCIPSYDENGMCITGGCNVIENVQPTSFKRRIGTIDRTEKIYLKARDNYLHTVIEYHQMICRQVKILEKSAGLVTTLANICIGIETSVILFLFIETNNMIMKTACAIILFFNGLLMFFYCSSGQQIIDENDLLRKQLAEIAWWNKPRQFQTSLLLMMTHANHDLHVKPYGLYILNYNTFQNILNASFSYLNMIRALK